MCIRSCRLKVQKGEADVSPLLFYWQPLDDVVSYSVEKRVRYLEEKLLP